MREDKYSGINTTASQAIANAIFCAKPGRTLLCGPAKNTMGKNSAAAVKGTEKMNAMDAAIDALRFKLIPCLSDRFIKPYNAASCGGQRPASLPCYAADSALASQPGNTSTAGWHFRALASTLARSTPRFTRSLSMAEIVDCGIPAASAS